MRSSKMPTPQCHLQSIDSMEENQACMEHEIK